LPTGEHKYRNKLGGHYRKCVHKGTHILGDARGGQVRRQKQNELVRGAHLLNIAEGRVRTQTDNE